MFNQTFHSEEILFIRACIHADKKRILKIYQKFYAGKSLPIEEQTRCCCQILIDLIENYNFKIDLHQLIIDVPKYDLLYVVTKAIRHLNIEELIPFGYIEPKKWRKK